MAIYGTVVGSHIAKLGDADEASLILQVEVLGPGDVRPYEYFSRPGDEYIPVEGSRVALIHIAPSRIVAITADDGLEPDPTLLEGDRKIYSAKRFPAPSDAEPDTVKVQATIKVLNTGQILIQAADGTENAVPLGFISITPSGDIEIQATDSSGSPKGKVLLANSGDIEIESEGGAATAKIKTSGKLEFNGTGDFLARFTELEAGFDELKGDHNSHTHTGNLDLPTSPPTSPSAASIAAAKIEEMEVPS